MTGQQTREFPAEVFARLAPDVFFERYQTHGLRPTGRKADEARNVEIRAGAEQQVPGSLGSAVVRAGSATVICGITGGTTRFVDEAGIYANVEIHRGGHAGNPTNEEQVQTARVHRVLSACNVDSSNFDITDHVKLVLTAQIVVLSRTGPVFDLVWAALVAALKACKVPKFEEDERSGELVPVADFRSLQLPISLNQPAKSFGFVNNLVLVDLDGPVEEECVLNTGLVVGGGDKLSMFSLSAPEGVSIESIKNSIK